MFSCFGGLQYQVERPSHEDVRHRRHQGQGNGDTKGCYDRYVDEAFTVYSIAIVDAVQCPADDTDDDGRGAKLRDAKDDVRNPESSMLIHVVLFFVQTTERLLSYTDLLVRNDCKNKR